MLEIEMNDLLRNEHLILIFNASAQHKHVYYVVKLGIIRS